MALEIIPYDAGSGIFIPVDESTAVSALSNSAVPPIDIIQSAIVIPQPFIITLLVLGISGYLTYKYLKKDHSQVNKSLNTPKR